MDRQAFEQWVRAYGAAWEAKDTAAFTRLFTEDARYYWTPFEAPKEGRAGIAEAFERAVVTQRDIHFGYEVLAVGEQRCVARWWCTLVRMATGRTARLDGILMVEPTKESLCAVFREWWHSDEITA
ncbi:MAG: nuclear transport factor 2 family protein [Rhodothermales bacterium]